MEVYDYVADRLLAEYYVRPDSTPRKFRYSLPHKGFWIWLHQCTVIPKGS